MLFFYFFAIKGKMAMFEKQKPNEESDNEEQETDGIEDMKVKGDVFNAASVT